MSRGLIDPPVRRIVCAAVLMKNEKGDCVKLLGPRHWDETMHQQFEDMNLDTRDFDPETQVEGFIDQWGTFFNREESLLIARRAGQLDGRQKTGNPASTELFSEDLY